MLDAVLAVSINCANLIKSDMLDTTAKNINFLGKSKLEEKNPIPAYFFKTVGYETTYIMTITGMFLTSAIIYNINPVCAYVLMKTIATIEFIVIVDNVKRIESFGYNQTKITANYSVVELYF